jgi:hypothetical protein
MGCFEQIRVLDQLSYGISANNQFIWLNFRRNGSPTIRFVCSAQGIFSQEFESPVQESTLFVDSHLNVGENPRNLNARRELDLTGV